MRWQYSAGLIATTATARSRRSTMLAAKASVLTTVVLAAGTLAVLASLLAVPLLLPGNGFTTTHGYPLLSLGDDSTPRAAAGSGMIDLALIALLSLGIATAVRDWGTAIGVVLALLYLLRITAAAVSDPDWQQHRQQIGTMSAGLAIQATNLQSLPTSRGAGLGVLVAWAAGAPLPGTLMLRLGHA